MEDFNFLHSRFDSSNGESGFVDKSEFKVIVVEDDRVLGLSIQKYLKRTLAVDVLYFFSADDCLQSITHEDFKRPFCLITDISLEKGADGLFLIDVLKDKKFDFIPIVMTGFASIENAIAATKKGVFHYLTKPFELENLHDLVVKGFAEKTGINLDGVEASEAASHSSKLDISQSVKSSILDKFKIESPTEDDMFQGMIGRSKLMREVFERIEKVADSDSTVLITGPSGTGKELVATALHKMSTRASNNMVSVNCGAIPSELLESELFGHVKGSFTGAISNRVGRFESANNGSIFLDEIGDMPILLQVKLLRVLQNKQIEPVGGTKPIEVDSRIIAATHRDLEKSVTEGSFREDLFYRLNVIPVRLPALKERREDIPLLISYFLKRFVSADGSNQIEFSDQALELIMTYDWPGNVRELENVIERLVILRGGNLIKPEDLPAKLYRHNPLASSLYKTIFELPDEGVNIRQVLSDIEDSLILQALERTSGNKNQASKLLSLNRTTLIEKMKKKQIEF